MAYQYITKYTSPNQSKGRPAGKPDKIVVHYWDRPEAKPSFDGVVNWLCRPNGTSSAHYVVEAGKVACLVAPGDRAWHAGPAGNPRGIGIECNPRMSAGDLETVAELIANLRNTYGNLPLAPHKQFMNTSCPGAYAGKLDWLSNRANQLRGKTIATPATTPKPTVAAALAVDGRVGPATVKKLQQVLGTTVDGVLSGQSAASRSLHSAINAIQYGRGGSQAVRALQKKLGVDTDGLLGPNTIRAWQKKLGVTVDASFGPATARALQAALNNGRLW